MKSVDGLSKVDTHAAQSAAIFDRESLAYQFQTQAAQIKQQERALLELRLAQGTLMAENALLAEHNRKLLAEREAHAQTIAIMLHDLRNPLAAAMTGVAILNKCVTAPDAGNILRIIQRNLQRVLGIAEDMLFLKQPDSAESLQAVEYDLAQQCRDFVSEMALKYDNAFDLQAPAELRVRWSKPHIERALGNLCIDALGHGGKDSKISISISEQKGDVNIVVRILDTQFPDELQPAKNPGIGLSSVEKIAALHGGSFERVCADHEGTFYLLRIPQKPHL